MEADPHLRRRKLVTFSRFSLTRDLVTELPFSPTVAIPKSHLLHAIDLRVLDLQPLNGLRHLLHQALAILKTDLLQWDRSRIFFLISC